MILQDRDQIDRQKGCFLELTSWGKDDDVWEGSIWLDGELVFDMNYNTLPSHSYRGVRVLILQKNTTGRCHIISSQHFDIHLQHGGKEKAEDLKRYIIKQRAGTVIAMITGDEATGTIEEHLRAASTIPGTNINVVKPVLSDMGVELNGM